MRTALSFFFGALSIFRLVRSIRRLVFLAATVTALVSLLGPVRTKAIIVAGAEAAVEIAARITGVGKTSQKTE